jgi:hypothetical protein
MTPQRNDDAPPADAIAMLKADHQRIRELCAHYEATTNPDAQWTIAEDVLGALDVHAQLEEQVFYPAVADQSDEGERLAQGSLEEHQQFPLMTRESSATMVADRSLSVPTIGFRLLK